MLDFVRRWTAQIQVQLSQLTVSQKLLIGTLGILLVVALGLFVIWSSQPEMTPLLDQASTPAERSSITAYLSSHNIPHRIEADRVLIPPARQNEVLAGLQMQRLLPKDTTEGFDSVVKNQQWWHSNRQNEQAWLNAQMKTLASVVMEMPGVAQATVFIDKPKKEGFSRTHRRPSSSVSVRMKGGAKVDSRLVEAIAGLVAGTVAEMTQQDVTVIADGRAYEVSDEQTLTGGDYLERRQAQEQWYRDKIADALSYIPQVIVAVNVELQVKRKETHRQEFDRDKSVELIVSADTRSTTSTEKRVGGEPGARPNTGADITTGATSGSTHTEEETRETFEPYAGQVIEDEIDPGGQPIRVNATVNVPRSFFVGLFMQGKPADTPPPDDLALKPLIDAHLQSIREQVEPLITAEDQGRVVVKMYPDASVFASAEIAGAGGDAGGIGGTLSLFEGGLAKPLALGGLAMFAVVLMLVLMRKAATPPKLPSASDLAGIPPALPKDDDIIGEAEELDAALTGLELDESQIRSRKLTEQVEDLVKSNPNEAASLISRWVKRTS
jgi:flagellar M-ring protein FliF